MRKRPNPRLCQALWIFTIFFVLIVTISAQSSPVVSPRLGAGIELFSQGKFSEAILEWRRVQADASTRESRAEALFWISVS